MKAASAAFVVWAVVCTLLMTGCQRERVGLAPGDLPPDVQGITATGTRAGLRDFQGKVVLLNFWATWCGSCIEELPELVALSSKYQKQNFEIVAVAVDDNPQAVAAFRLQRGLEFPLLIDMRNTSKANYQLTGVPETMLLDKAGRLVMFADPESGEPVVRAQGPRAWNAKSFTDQIDQLIAQ